MTTTQKRLQRILAEAGIASRRASEELIKQGRVAVNGQVAVLGAKADPNRDTVTLDGQPLFQKPKAVLLLNKPRGVVTTRHDPEGRRTVMDLLPEEWRHLHPVGRLDTDTAGLLLLTNDGDLTQTLAHPRHEVWKLYQATVDGAISDQALQQLRDGIVLAEGKTLPARVKLLVRGPQSDVQIGIRQGWNRQVRRMLEAVGYPVMYLKRLAIGPLDMGDLTPGQFRLLSDNEVARLRGEVEA